jgi:large subunit ribosomal protein L9
MKVILKGEVDNLGLAGDVVDVADGFARNYLLPRGLAIKATQGAMKEAEALTRSRKASEAKTLGSAQAAKDALEARTLVIPARVDERGSLYGSVSSLDIARVLKERGHDIPRKRIELKGTIKVIGSYEVPVHVHPQVEATVTVDVIDEEGKVTVRDGAIVNEDDVPPPPLTTETDELEELAEKALEAAEEFEAETEGEGEGEPARTDASDSAERSASDASATDTDGPTDDDEAAADTGEPTADEIGEDARTTAS